MAWLSKGGGAVSGGDDLDPVVYVAESFSSHTLMVFVPQVLMQCQAQ